MKKIIKLTEGDISNLVRKILNEQTKSPVAEKAAKLFIDSLDKIVNQDEEAALRAILMLKDGKEITEFSDIIKEKTGMSLYEYFNSKMSELDPEYSKIVRHIETTSYKTLGKKIAMDKNDNFNATIRAIKQSFSGKREE